MKKINKLVIKSFIGPFILTFFLILFILLMQFVWKYLDDLMGKGIEFKLIMELLMYQSTNLVSGALPLAVLLSSIMTMGSLAENYELVVLKSAGLSLFQITKGLILLIVFIAIGTFLFNNNITPIANLKFKTLLYDIVHQKPLLEIKEGNFYGDIGDFVLRVDRKDKNDRMYDVLIYDHRSPNKGNGNVIRAKEGEMAKTISGRYLILNLYDGTSYREMPEEKKAGRKGKTYTHLTTQFEEMTLRMDLSDFEFKKTDEDKYKNHREMLTMQQLEDTADSLSGFVLTKRAKVNEYLSSSFTINNDSTMLDQVVAKDFYQEFDNLPIAKKTKIIQTARNLKSKITSYLVMSTKEITSRERYIIQYWNEWHKRITLSVACIILFFIGAPLGAIIKKGGLGLPFLISVLIFLVFHITSMSGEKMARTGVLTSFQGMWFSTLILFPFSILLSIQAVNESSLMEKETYIRFFKKIFRVR